MMLHRVYVIVDSVRWIERLLPAGLELVQLRIKNQSKEFVQREIEAAQQLCAQAGACLVVNDHWQSALHLGCSFVHLGQTDLDTADVPALRRAGVRIGISTHSHDELERALSFDPDYVALGPIYPTTLKQMPWSPQGVSRVTEWKRRVGSKPLVAIGGLTAERLAGVFDAGADSAAVVSDILANPQPEARLRQWLSIASRRSV